MNETTISDQFQHGVRQFADYDNRRMIPHAADGLKVSLRKVLHTIIKNPGKHKVSNLGSLASATTSYQHGEDSIIDTVITLARHYPGSNNMPLLEALGQFGNALDHEASSPRYISTKLGPNYAKLYDERDLAILERQFDDDQEIEPAFFLPRLPVLLLNGGAGVGVGFRSEFLTHSLESVKKAVIEAAKTGKVTTTPVPMLNKWTGVIELNGRQVIYKGVVEIVGANKLRIVEAPPSVQLDKYKVLLNGLIEDKVINDYDNNSTGGKWDIEVRCPRAFASLPMEKILAKLGLIERATPVLNVWGFDGNMKKFESVPEFVEYWVQGRLPYYEKRRINELKIYAERMEWMNIKTGFIRWWLDKGTETVKSVSRAALLSYVDVGQPIEEETLSRLLRLPISSLTMEEIKNMEDEATKVKATVEWLNKVTAPEMMIEEVKAI